MSHTRFARRRFGRAGAAVALLTFGLTSTGCSTVSRHRVIVYDQPWSSAAAVQNLWCAPELRTACAQQAREAELDFPGKLSKAFRSAPECMTVAFVVLSDDHNGSKDLESKLSKNPGSTYWRLRVDFRPGLPRQPFTLGPGTGSARNGGDDAEHEVSYICEAAKNNGVSDYW
jgi:hypothetical protein